MIVYTVINIRSTFKLLIHNQVLMLCNVDWAPIINKLKYRCLTVGNIADITRNTSVLDIFLITALFSQQAFVL